MAIVKTVSEAGRIRVLRNILNELRDSFKEVTSYV